MTVEVPFQAHIDLLHVFLARRAEIVENIQGLLNAQRQPPGYLQDAPLLSDLFEDCFFTLPAVTHSQQRLRGQLQDAHWAVGFKPRALPGLRNGVIDPAEMMIRGFHLWQQTRWPGRNGRLRYAHTLFNLYLLRCLELLSVRVWDGGSDGAGDRLSLVQGLLDQLWKTSPADQPILLRDARWLIPLAQSPATDDLGAYFEIARKVAGSLSDVDRLEIHKAGVRMAAGHLRSQTRYYSAKGGVPLGDPQVVLNTRSSNALDFALLIQELVPLFDAYERACEARDVQTRVELADAICQGVSPDPELFLNRVELLGAYSMIEHLFVATDGDGQAAYTPMGQRHVRLLQEYESRIGRVSALLREDCARFRPVAGTYSPFGLLYGFSTDLIEHMAFKTLQPDTVTRFGLEDVFAGGDAGRLAWVNSWRKLPHLTPEVARQFDYPQQFADDMFERIERALRPGRVVRSGRLLLDRDHGSAAADVVEPEAYDEAQLSSDRREGRCLLSYQRPGGWVALRKTILTDVLAAGRDATVTGLPPAAAAALKLLCPTLVVPV